MKMTYNCKFRLWIEYALITVIVVTAATAATLWIQTLVMEANVNLLSSEVQCIKDVNEKQELAIATLLELRDKDGEALTTILNNEIVSSQVHDQLEAKVHRLNAQNIQVREFLKTQPSAAGRN